MGARHGGLEFQPLLNAEHRRVVMGRLVDALLGEESEQAVSIMRRLSGHGRADRKTTRPA
jgi:hypothetical protein